MIIVNTENFEALSVDEYMKYLDKAEMLREKGLLLDKSVVKLAKEIYEKESKNENS
jgi:hypothetical protein